MTSARPASHGSRPRAPGAEKASFPTTTPTVSPSHREDPYYGHADAAKMCDMFIRNLFQCPDVPVPATHSNPPQTIPSLARFIAYALHRTRLPASVTFSALFLLSRLKGRFPGARGSSGHRLWISAFMIASKVVCDDTYSNKSWAIVGQHMFTLKEINQMEREMCSYLEWLLNVDPSELKAFENAVREQYGKTTSLSTGFNAFSSESAQRAFTFPTSPQLYGDSFAYGDEPDPGSPYHSGTPSPATSNLNTPPTNETYPVPEDTKAGRYTDTDVRYLYVYAQHTAW